MQDVCIGIHERWTNSRVSFPNKGSKGGKKYLTAFCYDESGKFYIKRITRAEGIKIKLHGIWKKRKFVCQVCGNKFLGLIRHEKDVPECPYCKVDKI